MIGLKLPKLPGKKPKNRAAKAEKNARPAKARNWFNRRAALWMLFPPVGLTLMWRRSCTWPKAVKGAVTLVMAAALIAVFAIPAPQIDSSVAGVSMVSSRPEVEVYGPELPSFIVPGYTNEQNDSILVTAEKSDVHYVYAADGAKCYHEYRCKFAFASSQRLTVYEAYYLGFKPCGRCKPPLYDPSTNTVIEQEQPEDYDPS